MRRCLVYEPESPVDMEKKRRAEFMLAIFVIFEAFALLTIVLLASMQNRIMQIKLANKRKTEEQLVVKQKQDEKLLWEVDWEVVPPTTALLSEKV